MSDANSPAPDLKVDRSFGCGLRIDKDTKSYSEVGVENSVAAVLANARSAEAEYDASIFLSEYFSQVQSKL